VSRTSDVPPDALGSLDNEALLRRLRAAEAEIESLQLPRYSQESLADRLTAALSSPQVAVNATGPAAPIRAASIRAAVRRVRRRLRQATAPKTPGGVQIDTAAPESSVPGQTMDSRYPVWIELYDTVDAETRSAITARLGALSGPPLISIILPVYNAPEQFLRQAIDSVRNQLYQNWELCISDDHSSEPQVAKVLEEYADIDDRIRVVYRDTNGHISACSNSALSLASGKWICLMDHDDLLAGHALAMAVLAIHDVPNAALLYSDEDHISGDGDRVFPYFKPSFDPLLILGQNYFSHLSMLRTDLVTEVGGFRIGVEGSQDWDLVLRVIEQIDPSQIIHIPHVLYHWRSHSESTASSISAKPYVVEASRRVVQDHLDRIGVDATARNISGTSFNRITWNLGDNPPRVSVIILPRSGPRLCRCIDSIRIRSTYPNMEIVLLDDGGFRPPMRQYLRDQGEGLTVISHDADVSDSAQRNLAAAAAAGDLLFFLHDDVEVLSDSWLDEMVGILRYPGIGAVGAKLFYSDLTIQHAGVVVGIGGTVGYPHRLNFDRLSPGYFGRLMLTQCPSAVSWACMGVRRDAFDAVGGFNEEHFTGMFGDVDFCLRLNQAGWRTGWTPHAELIHFERPEDSRVDGENTVRFDRDIRMLHSTWGAWVENDPAYNPNLSLAHESLPLAWPPRKALT
jgi:GT2 family glycosyltransferase